MSLRSRISDWLRGPEEERTLTPAQLFNTGYLDWESGWWSASGQAVTPETVMQAAMGACVRLLADDISSLPADVFVRQGRVSQPVPPPEWLVSPSGRSTDLFLSYVSDWITSIGTSGDAFTLCLPSVRAPQYLEVLDPSKVDIRKDGDQPVIYYVNGQERDERTILHVPWVRLPGQLRGINPVQASRESVGLELAARKWAAAFFRNGGTLGGIVQVPPGVDVDADKLREQFEARHRGETNWWKPGVLTGGATYVNDYLKPAEADLEYLWKHVLEEAARVYHIPPHLLASQDPGAAARASIEERGIGYVRHSVRPFTTRFERAHSLLLPPEQFLKLNLNALMRGDAKTRAEYYSTLLDAKVLLREEVRDLEDMPFIGGLGFLETPNNNAPDADAPQQQASLGLSLDARVDDRGIDRLEVAVRGIVAEFGAAMDARMIGIEGRLDTMTDTMQEQGRRIEHMAATPPPAPREPDIRIDGDFVYYQRGSEVERKRVTRDAGGRVISIVAA